MQTLTRRHTGQLITLPSTGSVPPKLHHPLRTLTGLGAGTRREVLTAVRRVPVRHRVVLLAVVTVLTLVPALFSIARMQSSVDVDLYPVPGVRQAPGQPVRYVQRVLPTIPFLSALSSRPGNPPNPSFYRSIAVSPDANRPGAVRLTVLSPTPNQAAVALRFAAAEIASLSSTSSSNWFRVRDVLPQFARALARHDLSSVARRSILTQETFARAATAGKPPAGPLEAGKVTTTVHGLPAKIIADLPGNPRQPSPFWAGAAGFILGIALCATWIYMTASNPAVKLRPDS